jgi:hypothetical protein
VELTAVPDLGWAFNGWSVDLSGSLNPAVILMDGNKHVNATFVLEDYMLTVNVVGNGVVNLNVTGPYHYGDAVELTAVADAGWSFSAWSLDLSGSDNPGVLVIDANKVVNATFTEISDAYLVVRGMDNMIYYRVFNSSSGLWEEWNAVPGGATCDTPAATLYEGRLYLVVRGMDGYSTWFSWINVTDSSFSGWNWLSGATDSAPTLVSYNSQLILVVKGLDSVIYYRFYNCDLATWGDWIAWPGGSTVDTPSAAVLKDELHVVVRGGDGYSIWHSYINMTSSAFSGWQLIAGATESAPTLSVSESRSELILVVRGMDNTLYYNVWTASDWQGWSSVPNGSTCDGSSITVIDGTMHLVVRGMDGYTLWHGYVDLETGDFSGWTFVGGATDSAPTLAH